jgi:serine/threonine protein kinase
MPDPSPQGAPIDRYVVLKYLAEGGMGAIYLGKKLGAGGFEKEVVLKQLLPEFTSQPEFIDLFLREARLSATLDHANIIHTIDLVTAGDDYFIVMEYCEGGDLRTLLKKAKRAKNRLSAAAGLYITREVLSALAYAHNKVDQHGNELNLIHRDISPSNILVSRNGEVKLTDFGIAKASTHNSVFYRVKGKVGYMSPEQASNAELDHRSDLYSLAVCLYEIISGERLFVHAGLTTAAEDIYNQPIEPLSVKIPGLPPQLDEVMAAALALDPDDRYQTAGEFQEALLRCAHRCGLMMSTPELATHLRQVCGRADNWREVEGSATEATGAIGAGTEIYDEIEPSSSDELSLSDVEFDFDEASDENLVFAEHPDAAEAVFDEWESRRARAGTSITNLTRLKGLEMTSMIDIAGLDGNQGAQPLVDLDDLASIDSADKDFEQPADEGSSVDFDRLDDNPARGEYPEHGANPDAAPAYPNGDGFEDVPYADPDRANTDLDGGFADDQDATPVGTPRRRRRPWLILIVILLAGIGVAIAIGLSGPNLGGTGNKAPATQR